MPQWFHSLPRFVQRSLLLLAGLLNTLAYAPYDLGLLVFITLLLLLLDVENRSWRHGAVSGFIYGLGWFGGGISWVHVSIEQFGGLPLAASLALVSVLIAYLALFPALAMAMLLRFSPSPRYWPLAFPVFWLISEGLRGTLLSGFPWLSLGYAQMTSPLGVFAPVIGEVGITFIICLVVALLRQLLQGVDRRGSIAGLLLIVGTTGILSSVEWIQSSGETKKVALVQGNIEQQMRWAPEEEWPTQLKYRDLTRPHYDADLLIWPEAAIPTLEPSALDDLNYLDNVLATHSTAMISGIIDYNFETRAIYNALIVLGLKEQDDTRGHYRYPHANRYYKHHLLPIGEFVPFEDILRPIAPLFDLPMSSFSRGDARQTNLRANGINVVPAICYEIIFPRLLRQNIRHDSDFILTVSNDAWFGASIGPLQHLQIAQMRALEFGRPLLRATNNGVTAIIDEKGRIDARLPQFVAGVLTAEVALVTGQTPYLRFGDWPLWLFSSVGLIFMAWRRKGA